MRQRKKSKVNNTSNNSVCKIKVNASGRKGLVIGESKMQGRISTHASLNICQNDEMKNETIILNILGRSAYQVFKDRKQMKQVEGKTKQLRVIKKSFEE